MLRNFDYPITHIGDFSRQEVVDLIYKMFSLNEASDANKYVLSKSSLAKSGYSFGRCQHDCAQRIEARNFIKLCLQRANVSKDLINFIYHTLSFENSKLSDDNLMIVNNALSLQENKDAIDQLDAIQVNEEIDYVARVISNLKGEIGGKIKSYIMNNPEIFLQLVDYHNQFNLSEKGLLVKFLNGEKVDRSDLGNGKVAIIDKSKLPQGLLSEIRRFINEYTKYGIEHRKDCLRRQANISTLDLIKRPQHDGNPSSTPQVGPNPGSKDSIPGHFPEPWPSPQPNSSPNKPESEDHRKRPSREHSDVPECKKPTTLPRKKPDTSNDTDQKKPSEKKFPTHPKKPDTSQSTHPKTPPLISPDRGTFPPISIFNNMKLEISQAEDSRNDGHSNDIAESASHGSDKRILSKL